MITARCELQTPCVFDAMAAHCAMRPNIIIQMITTACELYLHVFLFDAGQHTVPCVQS